MYGLYCVFLCFLTYLHTHCEVNLDQSKNPLPYFRRQVEKISDDTPTLSSATSNTHSNLVSFLIKNVKKIYNELDDNDRLEITTILSTKSTSPDPTVTFADVTFKSKVTTSDQNVSSESAIISRCTRILKVIARAKKSNISNTKLMPFITAEYKNLTIERFSNNKLVDNVSQTNISDSVIKEKLMNLSKNLIIFKTDRRELINYFLKNATSYPALTEGSLRSCILCNNVAMENCNDPRNHLVTTTVCERDDDVCYSLHTPFGVVDRGCFSVNHNLTTYVCSCNLCNYISISEMPYIFSTQQEWVDNMVELARTRHLRKSVHKDISCLKCETNATAKTGDILDNVSCLEGNIESVPIEECADDEVCAVKAIKHDGYLWRGCTKQPLFNYWWGFCDTDLCNYEISNVFYTGWNKF